MQKAKFERQLVYHCGLTLHGVKVASMFAIDKETVKKEGAEINLLRRLLRQGGIEITVLKSCEQKILFLVYHVKTLMDILSAEGTRQFLDRYGYHHQQALEEKVSLLKKHMQLSSSFPHEIGIFLGYPLEDVVGFIEHKGKQSKWSGYWKVYANVEQAKGLFQQFTAYRMQLCKRWEKGASIAQILRTA